MKKLFFFKSSSGNGTDKQIQRQKESEKTSFIKSENQESENQALRRTHSLSSAAFLVDGIGKTSSNDPNNATGSSPHRPRNHSSRFRCFTPERQSKKVEYSQMYQVHDSSRSLSTCSSNLSSQVLDRYIDGEEHIERCKQKSGSSNSSVKGKRLPPRAQSPSPLSDNRNTTTKGTTRLNSSQADHCVENGLKDASSRSLARSVIERLSHTNGKSKASNLDVFANVPLMIKHYEPVNEYYVEGDGNNSELERKCKEAEKRVKLLTEELEEQKFLSDCDFDTSSLVGDIRQLEEERVRLASEVLSLLRSQMAVMTDSDLRIKRLEKEKSELQFGLETEFDRRSSEWTSKLESFQIEEKRLRERVRELAEHNVSLQREVSKFHEKETERIDMVRHMEETVTELSGTVEELREENTFLFQNLSALQESYNGTNEDLGCLRKKFEEKDFECKELNKSVTRFLRTCNEQEKTIQGLRDYLSEEITKQPSEKHEQMEQLRLTGVEFSLRKELESMKLEADSLRRENICLLSRIKGEEGDSTTFKLDDEIKMRVRHLQERGLSMLNESTELCYKLVKCMKEKLVHERHSVNNGLAEEVLIGSEMRVHGIRRGTESLKRSLETVTSLLLEKSNEVASNSESSPNNQSVEKFLRGELRAESLITSLLREKLYSKEEEIEQLQAEVAAGVRGNEVLQREVQNILDKLSINTHQLKDMKLQMVTKDENRNRLEMNLQETAKELSSLKVALPKVLEEKEQMWKELRECRERNMDLMTEKEMLKKKIEKLEEDTLYKEGQITILKDTLGSKQFDLFSSPEYSYNDFLVQ